LRTLRAHPLAIRFVVDGRRRLGNPVARLGHRLHHGCRVALVGTLQRHRYNRARLQIHGVLGFLRHMRGAVLHFCNPRIRVMRVLPILIRRALLPLPVQLG